MPVQIVRLCAVGAAYSGRAFRRLRQNRNARYWTGSPLGSDAWLIGSGGCIAFAALAVSSCGNGGLICGSIVAGFLGGL